MKRFVACTLATLAVSGCANNVWVHPSKDNAQFNQDKNDCIVQANGAIPNQVAPPQNSPPNYQTNCNAYGNIANCTTTATPGPNYALMNQAILNAGVNKQRDSFFNNCMQARGWTLQSAESVATMQAQTKDKAEQYQAGLRQISEEMKTLCTQSEYAAYYAKASCSASTPTIEQLSDNSKATKAEKSAISRLDVAFAKFRDNRIELTRNTMVPQAMANAVIDFVRNINDTGQKLRLELYNGKITWGQYNAERKKLAAQADADYKAIMQRYGAR